MSLVDFIRIQNKKRRIVAGLMSGTSCDGIDVCLTKIKGNGLSTEIDIIGFDTLPYNDEIRQLLFNASCRETGSVEQICRLNFTLGKLFANAVKIIAKKTSTPITGIDIVGSHGHTLYHISSSKENINGKSGSTLQIGEPSIIAHDTGITTIADFRTMDIAAGGEGAPLVPYTDFILFGRDSVCRVMQNIGGIANVTLLPGDSNIRNIIAFDSGPGNMVIDRFAEKITNGKAKFDKNGELASKGKPNEEFLEKLCSHPYLKKLPPKSTGREDFGTIYSDKLYDEMKRDGINSSDAIATVTAFTAKSITESYRSFIQPFYKISEVVLSGGGSHNQTLLKFLKNYLAGITIKQTDDFGIPTDIKEALSFAILANETLFGNPSNVLSATGAKERVVLGKIIPGK